MKFDSYFYSAGQNLPSSDSLLSRRYYECPPCIIREMIINEISYSYVSLTCFPHMSTDRDCNWNSRERHYLNLIDAILFFVLAINFGAQVVPFG